MENELIANYGLAGLFALYIIQQNFFFVKKLVNIIEQNTKAISTMQQVIRNCDKNESN